MKKIIIFLLAVAAIKGFAQTSTDNQPLKVSGYLETYFAYDFTNPSDHNRPSFVYSHNRHNEVNLNLGFVKAAYENNSVRANLALMAGTYANANLAAEPGVLKNIFEANAGVKLSKSKSIWLDAGVFASHIGFESAIGKDCWNLTRGILADNSPYYESGVKVSWLSDDQKWFLSGLILNGWQRIQRVNGNNTPAFGHQLTYKPNAKITLNSSSFIGSDSPDSTRQMRYFHNAYAIFQPNDRLGFIVGFDAGAQQQRKGSDQYYFWYTPNIIVRAGLNDKLTLAARAEYYSDENGVIIATGTQNGFQTFGYSVNLDYQINERMVWRAEGRAFNSKDPIFTLNESANRNNFLLTTALAVSF